MEDIHKISCPHCGFVGKTRMPPIDRAKMRCTKCGEVFAHREPMVAVVSDLDEAAMEQASPTPRTPSIPRVEPPHTPTPHATAAGGGNVFRPTNGPPTPKTTSVPWYTRREGERWRYARNTSYILDVLFAIPIALSLSTINAREMSWTMFPMVFFMSMMLACPLAILWGCMAWTGAYIAEQKGRERYEGVLFSVFLGPIGMLIEACLPDETRRAE